MAWDHLTMLCCLKDNAQINITFVLIMPSFFCRLRVMSRVEKGNEQDNFNKKNKFKFA